ncbi:MAG: nucleotide exchange factor GrpE [Paludibacteraceae bacterium]|nr:nucleotide exchange factor GrpE [Paludibacteraceae bacterium]MBR6146483.1 nucleotide exchange factor GrpE [Paludibacteraceae bacterium]
MSKKNEITEEELQPEELEQQEQEKQEAQEEQAEEGSKLEAELEEAQQQIEDLKDKNLRMMAEFENFRKRTAKEKLELQATAGERIFKDMLALVDDFERAEKAMADSEDVKAVREGIDLIHKKFIAFLADHDVKAIETEDADFDVDKHEAITTLAAGEDKKGKIIDCTQKGYTLGDKVIRYSKVVVGA